MEIGENNDYGAFDSVKVLSHYDYLFCLVDKVTFSPKLKKIMQ